MFLKLSIEEKNKMIKEIQAFFHTEREEEIGIIAAEAVLEMFKENLGILIYNKALDEAKEWFKKKLDDLDYEYDDLHKGI